ncbi:uncharacterized protein LOC130798805 [Amaranthus tricolor]|uniref:uncharacterized protein LOC130798805 n=1 Tax=Amaranthus tricolor TaxID=29722 RepID=UPI002583E620|nr:uncharacterized protein LOC130798805 [Amaranthus tricolor]
MKLIQENVESLSLPFVWEHEPFECLFLQWIMLVRIVVGEEIISIVSAYGPQVGLDEDADNYNSVHKGFGLGARNKSGENLLEFALAKKLVIANLFFRKKDEHLITYKSIRHATQVDYFLVRKGDQASWHWFLG